MSKSSIPTRHPCGLRGESFPLASLRTRCTARHAPIGTGVTGVTTVALHGACALATPGEPPTATATTRAAARTAVLSLILIRACLRTNGLEDLRLRPARARPLLHDRELHHLELLH